MDNISNSKHFLVTCAFWMVAKISAFVIPHIPPIQDLANAATVFAGLATGIVAIVTAIKKSKKK